MDPYSFCHSKASAFLHQRKAYQFSCERKAYQFSCDVSSNTFFDQHTWYMSTLHMSAYRLQENVSNDCTHATNHASRLSKIRTQALKKISFRCMRCFSSRQNMREDDQGYLTTGSVRHRSFKFEP
jgi:hypothetical protein